MRGQLSALLIIFLWVSGCTGPQFQPLSDIEVSPSLTPTHAIMSDGYQLPFSHYKAASGNPKAIAVSLHGFNDYREAFAGFCQSMAAADVECFAYDQRGFGETEHRGLWPADGKFQQDLATVAGLLKAKYPGKPIYLVGESMGGAVIMTTMTSAFKPDVDGIVLLAPAVWARETQPWYQRLALWITVHTVPGWQPTGEGLNLTPTDNREALRKMSKDPLVIKATRIDALYGINNLMDEALAASTKLNGQSLILYGKKDEIIPKYPTCQMLAKLQQGNSAWQLALYDEGYHMLTRDLQAQVVFDDISQWMLGEGTSQPPAKRLAQQQNFCSRFNISSN